MNELLSRLQKRFTGRFADGQVTTMLWWVLFNLICILASKGILTETDVTILDESAKEGASQFHLNN